MSDNYDSLINRAEHLVEIERWSEAIPLLAKALGSNPDDFQANAMMSLCNYSLGNKKEALKYAEKAIASEPEEEWGHRLRSLTLLQMGDTRGALKSAEEAARIAPYEPFTLNSLATILLERNKTKRAREIAEQMVEIAPHIEQSHFTMGNVALKEQNYWEAEKAFRRALHINPAFADARNNLGVAMMRQETAPESNGIFNKAVSLTIFAKQNPVDPDEIEESFREALKLDPTNEVAAQNLRFQYSYVGPAVLAFAYLPFTAIAFSVIPLGALIMLAISFVRAGRWASQIREKRKDLSPEMLAFVKGDKSLGENGPLNRVADAIWNAVYKTWKPHALALGLAALNASKLLSGNPTGLTALLGALCVFGMIGACFWLAYESRKDD